MYDIILGRTSSDTKKFGKEGTVFLGKQYVQMGEQYSLSNPIYLDVARAHAMLIVGKRGGGKCLSGDSEILLSSGKKVQIKELFDTYSKSGSLISDSDEYFELNKEIFVKSFDIKTKKIVDKKVTHVFRRNIKETLVKWKFQNSELITTKDHKILCTRDLGYENFEEEFEWKTSQDKIENYFFISYDKNNNKYCFVGPSEEEVTTSDYEFIKEFNFEGFVYDLTIEDTHNFIANDIIVHNSYTMGSLAEGLADMNGEVAKNLSFVLMDTMGVYWSMKYGNKKEEDLLEKWGLEAKGLDVVIFVPGEFYKQYKEDGVPVDFPFYIKPNELSIEDWMSAFKLRTDDIVGVGVQRVIGQLLKAEKNFSIDDVISLVEEDTRLDEKTKLALINRFDTAKSWGIFSKNGTPIKDILIGGKVTVMDFSPYVAMAGGWEVKALVLGIISKKIFVERMMVRKKEEIYDIVNKTNVVKQEEVEDDLPMPWLIVDECHEFLPAGEEEAPSKKALMTILREGRQPGVSLIMATQQPAKIHTDAITQSDIVLAHRITASFDLEALDKIFLSYDTKGSKDLFNSMPKTKGCAIIMDDKNERLHTMQIKPRFTWHGGEDPNAIREIKDEFDF